LKHSAPSGARPLALSFSFFPFPLFPGQEHEKIAATTNAQLPSKRRNKHSN
jgi:hypothetical protein